MTPLIITTPRAPPTIFSNRDELREYYDNTLDTDPDLTQTSNDKSTPLGCVEEIIKTIPQHIFENPSLKWLDGCCGSGNWFVPVFWELVQYHSPDHILTKMLFFNDINRERLQIVRHVFCANQYQLNISNSDFLEDISGERSNEQSSDTSGTQPCEQYDIILANPPFARLADDNTRTAKNHNLIGPFLKQSLLRLRPSGHLIYLTPNNWLSLSDRNTLIRLLTSLQIVHLDLNSAKKYFKKIGSSFTYYCIENVPHYKPMIVAGIHRGIPYSNRVVSGERDYIPLYYTDLIRSILLKTVDSTAPKFAVETSSDLHKYTRRDIIRPEQSPEFPNRLHHTGAQTVYASRPHKYQLGWKVFIVLTSYYKVFADLDAGMTQSIAFIRCDDEETALMYEKILQHPLYRFINNICRWGNFNNIRLLQRFPVHLDPTTIYSHFEITNDEIALIEREVPA